jgi:hypothetical protein
LGSSVQVEITSIASGIMGNSYIGEGVNLYFQ